MGKGTVRFVTSYVIKTILTTKASGETSKIQNGILQLQFPEGSLSFKMQNVWWNPYAGKAKTKFRAGLFNT